MLGRAHEIKLALFPARVRPATTGVRSHRAYDNKHTNGKLAGEPPFLQYGVVLRTCGALLELQVVGAHPCFRLYLETRIDASAP